MQRSCAGPADAAYAGPRREGHGQGRKGTPHLLPAACIMHVCLSACPRTHLLISHKPPAPTCQHSPPCPPGPSQPAALAACLRPARLPPSQPACLPSHQAPALTPLHHCPPADPGWPPAWRLPGRPGGAAPQPAGLCALADGAPHAAAGHRQRVHRGVAQCGRAAGVRAGVGECPRCVAVPCQVPCYSGFWL
jgi:hypothetical protein